jgi:hypothetical protein
VQWKTGIYIPLGGIVSMEFHLEEDGNENGVSEAF